MNQQRPECMHILQLLPPYSEADVRRAYRAQAQAAHPDTGGSAQKLQAVREAYKQALEYLEFRGDRRRWMALQVDRYRQTQDVLAILDRRRAETFVEAEGWKRNSLGDFAHLTERILMIRLNQPDQAMAALAEIAAFPAALESVRLLDLGGSRICDDAVPYLLQFTHLLRLDVRETELSQRAIRDLIASLKDLEAINVNRTRFGLLSQLRVRLTGNALRFSSAANCPFDCAPSERFSLMQEWTLR